MQLRPSSRFLAKALAPLSLVLFLALAAPSIAKDYKGDLGVAVGLFEENRVARLAASLGRGSGMLSADEVKAIVKAMNAKKPIPAGIEKNWQKLLRMAQSIDYLEHADRFYPVGYEWESIHKAEWSWVEWEHGSEEYKKMIAGAFGVTNMSVFNPEAEDKFPHTKIYDEEGRQWSLTTEHVEWDVQRSGYELGTPPVMRATELEQIAAFRATLGRHKMGQSNMMTGAHQTYFPFPVGEKEIDPKLAGRVAANLQILNANYAVAIHDIMHVRRMGGAEENLFFRPLIYDHYELLQDFANADPKTFDLEAVRKLLFEKYFEKEFEIQLKAAEREEAIEPAKAKKLRASEELKRKFKNTWKYRDAQLKIGKGGQPILLWESRIGDYIADEPEQAMLKTLVDQLLIDEAYTLAKAGKIAKLTVPPRKAGEAEAAYWQRLQLDPNLTPEHFMAKLGPKQASLRRMILGKSFETVESSPKMASFITFAFEMEGWDEAIVKVVLPREPKLRAKWRKMSEAERVTAMERMGFDFEGEMTKDEYLDQYRILVTEFYGDHQKNEFMHPDLKLETSGNWEVKTYGRYLRSQEELEAAVKKVGRNLNAFGLHLHAFLPDPMIQSIVGANADAYGKFLELQSFGMMLKGYAEADPKEAGHWLDSWSLDRFSTGDIEAVKGHLKGKRRLDALAQKYHNIAFRPVPGGLDIEPRDLDDDVQYGLAQIKHQLGFIADPKMPAKVKDSRPIFAEFKEHADLASVKRYTLAEAVGEKYPLTAEQKKLLHLFQFEVYKPSMSKYMFFKDFAGIDETPDVDLDLAYVRANFENNIAVPLLNYRDQAFIDPATQKLLAQGRDAYVDRIYKRLLAVQKDPRYAFLKDADNFHDLCEYLERSKHPSKPKTSKLPAAAKRARREALDDLTYDLRGEMVRYVKQTRLDEVIMNTVKQVSCTTSLRPARKNPKVERVMNRSVRRSKM